MQLSQITSIGWCANMMLDRKEYPAFSFKDIFTAADERRLVALLQEHTDDSGIIELWARDPSAAAEVETALGNATEALRDRELRKAGVGEDPLCMIIAIVLEAIQQNFSH